MKRRLHHPFFCFVAVRRAVPDHEPRLQPVQHAAACPSRATPHLHRPTAIAIHEDSPQHLHPHPGSRSKRWCSRRRPWRLPSARLRDQDLAHFPLWIHHHLHDAPAGGSVERIAADQRQRAGRGRWSGGRLQHPPSPGQQPACGRNLGGPHELGDQRKYHYRSGPVTAHLTPLPDGHLQHHPGGRQCRSAVAPAPERRWRELRDGELLRVSQRGHQVSDRVHWGEQYVHHHHAGRRAHHHCLRR